MLNDIAKPLIAIKGLCNAWGPQATNSCLWMTRKTDFLHKDQGLGTLDFLSRSLWAPCDSSNSTALIQSHSAFLCPQVEFVWQACAAMISTYTRRSHRFT